MSMTRGSNDPKAPLAEGTQCRATHPTAPARGIVAQMRLGHQALDRDADGPRRPVSSVCA
jgi:hypothetical protein